MLLIVLVVAENDSEFCGFVFDFIRITILYGGFQSADPVDVVEKIGESACSLIKSAASSSCWFAAAIARSARAARSLVGLAGVWGWGGRGGRSRWGIADGRGWFRGTCRQKAWVDGGYSQSTLSTVIEFGRPDVSGPATYMEHRQTFAGGLSGIGEEIDEKPGGDGFAAAKFIQSGFVERGQRYVTPGGDHRVRRIRAGIASENASSLSKMLGKALDFALDVTSRKIRGYDIL